MKLAIFASLLAGCVASSEAGTTEQPILGREVQNVRVANTETDPAIVSLVQSTVLAVRDTDEPARHAFHQKVHFTVLSYWWNDGVTIPLPAGKRLVIEDVSASIMGGLQDNVMLAITGNFGGTTLLSHYFSPIKTTWENSYARFVVSAGPQRIYYDASAPLTIGIVHDVSTSAKDIVADVSISGHLVDMPTATDGL